MGLSATAKFTPRDDLGRFVEVNITPGVRASVEASCKLMEDEAKRLCPVDTGRLQDSIGTVIDDSGKTIIGRMGTDVEYAPYVEFGTGQRGAASSGAGEGPYSSTWPGMPAQPFMRPALDNNRGAVVDLFRSNILLGM